MEIKWITTLLDAGVDTEKALKRFSGNAALYYKFLLKFPQDDTFDKIGPALDKKNWESALTAAHTLKGVAENLGLTPLFDACCNTVFRLRAQDYEGAADSCGELKRAYEKLITIILEEE